jgi:hypothetical protein
VRQVEKSGSKSQIQEKDSLLGIESGLSAVKTAKKTKKKAPPQKVKTLDTELQVPQEHGMHDITPPEQTKLDGPKTEPLPAMHSSPPFSPPKVTNPHSPKPTNQLKISLEQCLQTTLDANPSSQLSSTPFKPNPSSYLTPSQPEPAKAPPLIRKAANFFDTPSRPIEPLYIASPCPATDMPTEDFVMLRRKREVFADEDLEPLPQAVARRGRGRGRGRKSRKDGAGEERSDVGEPKGGKGGKWVRFLDVGVTCPSDESDELSICKPSWVKKKDEVVGQ